MLTEEQKKDLISQIEYEELVKKKIDNANPPNKKIWGKLNSNLSILLIGSLITAGIVPIFQNNQRQKEWIRQIKYEEVNFYLAKHRECLSEFLSTAAFTAEVIEKTAPYIEKENITFEDYNKYKDGILQLNSLRFRQNTKVASLAFYFEDTNQMQIYIDRYILEVTNYIRYCEDFIKLKYCNSNPSNCSDFNSSSYELEYIEYIKHLKNLEPIHETYKTAIAQFKIRIDSYKEKISNLDI